MRQQGYPQENIEVRKAFREALRHANEAMGRDEECGSFSDAEYDLVWQPAYDAKMLELGWKYTGDHCFCDPEVIDEGRPHEPACGWTKVEGGGR